MKRNERRENDVTLTCMMKKTIPLPSSLIKGARGGAMLLVVGGDAPNHVLPDTLKHVGKKIKMMEKSRVPSAK